MSVSQSVRPTVCLSVYLCHSCTMLKLLLKYIRKLCHLVAVSVGSRSTEHQVQIEYEEKIAILDEYLTRHLSRI